MPPALIAINPLALLLFAAFFIDGTDDGIGEMRRIKKPIKAIYCVRHLQCAENYKRLAITGDFWRR